MGWTATAQLLAVAVCTPTCGRLAEIVGLRRIFLGAVVLFVVASAAAALSPATGVLIAARAVQGVGAAGLIALSSVAVAQLLPTVRRGRGYGVIAGGTAVGQASGPAFGGLVAGMVGWRALFLAVVAAGLIVLAGALRQMPPDRKERRRANRVDVIGALLTGLTTMLLLLTLTTGIENRFTEPWVIGCAIATAGAAGALACWTRRATVPFLPPALLRDRRYLLPCLVGFLALYAFLAVETLVPLYSAQLLGLGSGQIGLILLPGTAAMIALSVPCGRLADRWGTRPVAMIGLLMTGMSAVWLAHRVGDGLIPTMIGMIGVGVGFASSTIAALTAAAAAAAAAAPVEHRGIGLGLFQSIYSIGGAFGAVISPALAASAGADAPMTAHTGYAWALLAVTVPVVIGGGLSLLLPVRLRSPAAP